MAGKQRSTKSTSNRSTKRKELTAPEIAEAASRHIAQLTGKDPIGVTAIEQTEDGWQVGVEVIEGTRVPSTADMLAVYQADLDLTGELLAYRRKRRYVRSSANGGEEDGQ